jgi:hypothetical protein
MQRNAETLRAQRRERRIFVRGLGLAEMGRSVLRPYAADGE